MAYQQPNQGSDPIDQAQNALSQAQNALSSIGDEEDPSIQAANESVSEAQTQLAQKQASDFMRASD